MSEPAAIASQAAQRAGSMLGRVARAFRALPPERRLAAGAAVGLFVTLFLPWYQETVVAAGKTASASLTGWAAFSFVEAAVLLVAAGVLTLLFKRAEGRAFHLPGGDGGVITAAGAWTCVLVIWRILDKENVSVSGPGTTASGVEWGIFAALVMAALLTYAGTRIRRAHTPEPPLPADDVDWMTEAEVERPLSSRRSRGSREARPTARDGGDGGTRDREPRDSRRPRESGRPRESSRPRRSDAAAAPPAREPRPRAPRAANHDFPTPEPLEEPPTLRLGDLRPGSGPATPGSRAGEQVTDEQMTMPLDETEPER